MHDGLQLGTLVLVLFGILLTRYDANALRKEMNDMRKELTDRFDKQTTTIIAMLFKHEERLTRVEAKLEEKK